MSSRPRLRRVSSKDFPKSRLDKNHLAQRRKGAKATENFLCVLASLREKLMNLTMKCDLTVTRKKMT
jgi:hypothetical protein